MPRIPTITGNPTIENPGISPSAAGAPWAALARAGQDLSQTANYGMHVVNAVQEAARKVKASEIESGMSQDLEDAASSFQNRTDFENFDSDAEKAVNQIRSKYMEQVGSDQILQRAVDTAYTTRSREFLRAIQMKKSQEISNRGIGQLEALKNVSLDLYSKALSPEERDLIRHRYAETANSFAESKIISFKSAVDDIHDFNNTADSVRADRQIEADPQAALTVLRGGGFDKLSPDVLQSKIEKAEAAVKAQQAQEQIRQNEIAKVQANIKKQAHDDQVQRVGDLYLAGKYSDAYYLVSRSDLMTGDEKRTWGNAIKAASKPTEAKIDPTVQASEIVKINGMISRDEAPDAIRSYIIQTPNLKKDDKEQYLNKLESKLSSEMSDGRKRAYQEIEGLIVPKRGAFATLLQTPLETQAVSKAQMAFDDWLEQQRRENKYPTVNECRKKGIELGVSYQVPMAAKMQEIEQEAKRQASEMKGFAQSKEQGKQIVRGRIR